MGPIKYVNRYYRLLHEAKDLVYFNTIIKDSDLAIGIDIESCTDSLMALCRQELIRVRRELENYILLHPDFQSSFQPVDLFPGAPLISCQMAEAASMAGVGPMAAVAGAFAQTLGEKLYSNTREVIVENGGDIYINSSKDRIISIFAGDSKFSNRIGIRIKAAETPVGICTSSGTVGPSLSLGKADAVVIKGMPAALADAVATGAGNLVKTGQDLMKAVDYAKNIPGISGIIIIKHEKMAVWGEMEIIPVERRKGNESSK